MSYADAYLEWSKAQMDAYDADEAERYGKDGEVWCGARRDQAGTAYCVEMAGHEQDGVPHLWKATGGES